MKKVICFLLIISFFAAGLSLNPAYAEVETDTAEVLIEATTGQVLYSKNADRKLPMASVTKEMALLLWAEMLERSELSLDENVKASSYA
ncbi:MAG: D-alanyl-D-alanine carboxypeptidase, partial [Oscillospiraceae bacterium]|nr:D-alanyl-D-alanine carboxypeptidase [Oscillospiraceae bacterium]